jgi:acyl carrier protein
MTTQTFEAVAEVLAEKFAVEASRIRPDATLESLGLDSLTLMEFVFAVEDRFSVRIPEDRLDPLQAGVTLGHLSDLLEDALLTQLPADVRTA